MQFCRKDCVSDGDSDDNSDDDSDDDTNERIATDDCHVLIRWSQIDKLVKQRMACASCGTPVTTFNRRTVGIATEIDFSCPTCKEKHTGAALTTGTDDNKERIDSY